MALRTVKPSSPPIKTISIPAATENENGKKQKDEENDDFDGSSHFAQQQQQQQQRRRRVSFSDFELLIDCAESPASALERLVPLSHEEQSGHDR